MIFNRPVGIWLAKAEPTASELRAVWRAQELATVRLEIRFRNQVSRIIDTYARRAANDAANIGANVSVDISLAGIEEELNKSFSAQYRRTAEAFGNDLFDSLEKSRARYDTKDQGGIFQGFIAQFIADNAAARVKQVANTTKKIIRSSIQDALDNRLAPDGMARLILARAAGIASKKRAQTIARTETHTAAQFGQQAASNATGLQFRKYWVASDDERVRADHSEADSLSRNTIVKNNEPFQVGGEALLYPGDPAGSAEQTINCFVPSTKINSADVMNASKIPYSGDVVKIKTLGGRVLSVTPNHRILTTVGFVPACKLTESHNLVCQKTDIDNSVSSIGYDKNGVPPSISEVFSSLANLSGSFHPRGVGMDFHGDEKFFNGDIQVVFENSLLDSVFDADICKSIRNFSLKKSGDLECFLFGNGLIDKLLVGRLGTLASSVGFFNLLSDSVSARGLNTLPFFFFRFGSASPLNSVFAEYSRNYTSVTPKLFANLILRYARFIETDNISGIDVHSFSGHVYDLHTVSGYIIAENMVVSNCRCGVARRPLIGYL